MSRWPLAENSEMRILSPADASELFALVCRNRNRLAEYLPWVHRTQAVSDVADFLTSAAGQHAAGLGFHAGIVWDGRLAGCAGMHPIDKLHRSVALGYWIDENAEGRGLATRATAQLVHLSFAEYGLHRVEIRCAVGNHRSRAIPLRLGFREEGILRHAQLVDGRWFDLHIFGRLATD
jgi:ribosomal-protein-serine acetyltransferase